MQVTSIRKLAGAELGQGRRPHIHHHPSERLHSLQLSQVTGSITNHRTFEVRFCRNNGSYWERSRRVASQFAGNPLHAEAELYVKARGRAMDCQAELMIQDLAERVELPVKRNLGNFIV